MALHGCSEEANKNLLGLLVEEGRRERYEFCSLEMLS